MSATLEAPAPIDPNAGYHNPIPRAVRDAAARADQLQRQINTPLPEPQVIMSAEQPAFTTVVTDPAQPPLPGFLAPTVGEPPTVVETEETWEQRFRSLKGRFDAQIPALTARAQTAEQLANELRVRITALEVERANAPAANAAPSPTVVVPDTDVAEYGQDLVDATRRWARAEVATELEQLRSQITLIQGDTQAARKQSATASVHSLLDANVPNWRAINDDPEFFAWLSQVDPFSGVIRHGQMNEAYRNGEAGRVLAFFTAFAREHTAINPSSGTQPAHTADPAAGRLPLENLAAPGRARPTSPGAPTEPRFFSRNDIAAFYSDVRRGAYRGREAEQFRIEQDIIKASTEGRVR